MRPRVMHPRNEPTLWVDFRTGWGVDPSGITGRVPGAGGRKNANLTDVLNQADHMGLRRIVFVGPIPPPRENVRHWLYVQTPGWEPGTHWLDPAVGRFTKKVGEDESDHKGSEIEVRTAEEWFGSVPLNPREASEAWHLLWTTVAGLTSGRESGLMKTPAATGANLWAASLPQNLDLPVPPADIREELRHNSGQHHIDHFVAGGHCDCGDCAPLVEPASSGKVPGFFYVDGRFMYASVCRELGVGGERITATQANHLLHFDDRGRYARAWYKITARVPNGWDHLGILPAKLPGTMEWHYPNRPGAKFTAWADAAEVDLALTHGWGIEVHEGILFTKARVMDTFAQRIIAARETVEADATLGENVRKAAATGLRAILLHGIGTLYSRGREIEKSADVLREVPAEYRHVAERHGKRYVWKEPAQKVTAQPDRYWPEIIAQVWGRARARVLSTPTAHGREMPGGALAVPPTTLIGIYGDAIYTSELPMWSLPIGLGGGDDGKVGRLRLQGALPRPQAAPLTREARDRLRARADKEGTAQVLGMIRGRDDQA